MIETQTRGASGWAGGGFAERAGRRSAPWARAAPWALWLIALLVGPAAVAGETPASPQTAPPEATADTEAAQEPETTAPSEEPPQAEAEATPETEAEPPPAPGGPLRLNFKDASLHAVLEYLSEAAGLVIIQEPTVEGRVTIMSRQPLNIEEAIALLDTVLREKGYAAIRTGRNLKIVALAQAARENLPVYSGSDPSKIPVADKIVTQIIPVRFADATQLKTDLAPLLPSTATLSANAASNTLVLVDTQANIRRIVQIIQALDAHMVGVTEVKVFQLQYADAANTARLITELFRQEEQRGGEAARRFSRFRAGMAEILGRRGERGGAAESEETAGRQQKVVASADVRTNTLVVSASPDLLKVIDGIVQELDSNPTEEEAFFIYPLKNANAKNIETVLNQIFSETGAAGGAAREARRRGGTSQVGRSAASQRIAASAGALVGQVYCIADEDTNSLLVRAATKHFDRIREILAELDRAIPQVLIKALIAEVTHDDQLDLGTEFSVLNLGFDTSVEATVDLGPTADVTLVTATLDATLSATFNALQREGRLNVLSRPYILASDNQEATITVGQEVPRITQSRTTETGQTIDTIQYEDVGIILTVTPHVNPDGLVIMDVAPEISSISDTTVPLSGTVNATVYAKRSAETRVAIHNGQTIVIGGLMEDRITDAVRKVPLLGDIPLLGALFRRTTQRKVKTELLIFLTPHVAQRPDHLPAMSEDEMAGAKSIQDAAGQGAFEEHMEGMRRGATPEPAGEEHETQP